MKHFFSPGSKLYSIFGFKCPKCHIGNQYLGPAYQPKTAFEMNKNCNHCGQRFMLEPGFYWGAMYIAYALASGFLLSSFGLLFFLFQLNWKLAFTLSVVFVLFLYVLIFRLARSLWINIYVNYDPPLSEKS
jgi:hypothetical protein